MSNPVMNMDSIPFPDFDDYFAALRYSRLGEEIDTELVIETSRGCWWGEKFQCTFCGLNGSTMKYRSKSVSRVLDEIKYLINRYNIRKLQVVDNILDLKYIDELFPQIYNERLDVKLFYETKANISKKQLMVMTQGGIVAIQPGIENLSDSVLKIMKKGVTALQNIQLLKWCREIGIIPLWNLIWGFPTEPEEEYDRMARLVPLLVHLHPPSGIGSITLDRYSPYFVESLQHGVINVRPWKTYKFLYPLDGDDLFRMAYHFDFDYSDGRNPDSYTKELEQQIQNWKELWISDDKGTMFPPALIMAYTQDLIMIRDTRPSSIQRFQVLANEEAKIYGLCETMHTFDSIYIRIKEDFPLFKEEALVNVLSDLIDKKLMVYDNSRYLSLAIPAKSV
jgi:ribosomal peptide maturation radical SAM protein 1